MEKIKGLCLQDVHFGIKDSDRLYSELKLVLDKLETGEYGFLSINGDYFDRKLSLNEPTTALAINFFGKLISVCKDHNIIFRLIQGTRSHDLNQLQIFEHFTKNHDIDFKIIQTAQTESVYGMNILYLPEEYPENSEAYYKPFIKTDTKYDLILGHGTWDFMAFESQKTQAQDVSILSAPVLFYKDWAPALTENGKIIFGHIHSRNVYKNKIFYSGSFTRWGYGEKSARGFTVFETIPENRDIKVGFIDNELAPKYETISIADLGKDIASELSISDLEKVITDDLIADSENLRIDLTGLSADVIEFFKAKYKDNKNVKIETKTVTRLLSEEHSAVYDKYDYVLNRSLPIDETIKKFAKDEFDKNIELDTVKKIIASEV